MCADFGAELVEMNARTTTSTCWWPTPPHVAVARLVNSLKGVSARRLRQRWRVRTHREHLWSPSSFAASAGAAAREAEACAPLEALKQYIRQQRTPDRPG